MINVNQITSQLARMPDQALQQYAQMHKSDPYIMALALSESNRRKQMRSGAQMNASPQPKVVDQEIQGMAAPMPENVGIGQLPAGDMNFADGGIVAFSGGGDVPRYQSQGLVQGYSHGMVDPSGLFGLGPEAMAYDQARVEEILARKKAAERAARIKFLETAAPETAQRMKQEGAATPDAIGRLSPGDMALRQQPVAAPPPAAPKPDAGDPRQRLPVGGPGAAAAPAAGLPALTPMQSPSQMHQSAMETVPLVDPAAGQREALGSEMIGGAERRARTLKEDIAKEGDVFAGRGERIGQREAKLKDYEGTNQSLALLNAGLAIMSTPGGLATAIGKGARVGTEQYAAGLDKIRAAQERLEDAKDNLDTLRLNRADMNRKEVRATEADIDRAKMDAKKLGIEGIMAASDLRQKQASDLFKGTLEQAKTVYAGDVELRGREIAAKAATDSARISAGAQLGLLRAIANDPKLQAVYGKGQGQNKIMDEYTDFVKANPQYLANESAGLQAFLRTKGVLSSLGSAGAAPSTGAAPGPVLPRKD
jgi:hypothetical protein